MPHLIVLYSANLESETDMSALCRRLADAMLTVQDEQRQQVFPTGGVRVFAYPASHYALADGQRDYAPGYLNLRMAADPPAPPHHPAGKPVRPAPKPPFGRFSPRGNSGFPLRSMRVRRCSMPSTAPSIRS